MSTQLKLVSQRLIASLLLVASTAHAQPRTGNLEEQLLRQDSASLAKAARAQGDPVRGGVLFHQRQLSCTKCHACGGSDKESPLGPDLARPASLPIDEAQIVESLLSPSKVLRKGYETVTLVRRDGTIASGLVSQESPAAVVLRDPALAGKEVTIPTRDIDERSHLSASLMPTGLANQFADRQQFLDLVAFLIESAEFGPARARSLRPDPAVIDPPLPAYEHDLDHAGLIGGLDAAAYARGEALYARICASCHGTLAQVGSMPTSLRFAEGKFKNGSDPMSLYKTLTLGYGMMAAQSGLVPRQKYDVLHYIREAFLKRRNPSQYVTADENYLANLPKGTSRGPSLPDAEPWRRTDYGPSLAGTFEIGEGGGNIACKGVAVRLDPGPGGVAKGNAWAVFEHDTLRMAGGWSGNEFIDWNGINFNGRHEIHPHATGKIGFETANGPGWANPVTGSFDDPRLKGRDGKHYGPLPGSWGKYRGLYHRGDKVVFSYLLGETPVLESPGLAEGGKEPAFTRAFEIGPRANPLTLRVLRHPGGKTVAKVVRSIGGATIVALPGGDENLPVPFAGIAGGPTSAEWTVADDGHLLLRLPSGPEPLRFTVWAGTIPEGASLDGVLSAIAKGILPPELAALIKGGPPRWDQMLTTNLMLGNENAPFAADALSVPDKNPWRAQLRLTGIDFLAGGTELMACTWDGDVWRVSGLDRTDGLLAWRRVASGLFQPLGLKVFEGATYVGCRDQIAILRDLNDDGETDFYECFNSDHLVTESFHEFAMDLQTDAEGNFFYAKGARHGKQAVVPHHGTLLKVSKDGSQTEIVATGFRAPNGVCVNPDGTFFMTDQEGHWVPKNRINWVRPGNRFFGNLWGFTDVEDRSDAAQEEPLCWITNRFDRSPAELVRVASPSWGGLNGALLNLSYGSGKVFVVPHEQIEDGMQGGMVALPLPPFPTGVMRGRFNPSDGHLYLCGMYAWAGNRQEPGGLYRIRATGKPACLPVTFHVSRDALALTFSDALQADAAADVRNFGVKAWDLARSQNYGSAHLNERSWQIAAAKLSSDSRTVTLAIPDLQPTRGLELWYSVRSADGREIDGLLHGSVRELGD